MSNSKIKKCFLTIISLQKLKVYRLYHLKKLKLKFLKLTITSASLAEV